MKDSFEDQRAENRMVPNVPVTHEDLAELGIFYRKMNAETMLEPTVEIEAIETTKTTKEDGSEVEVTTKTTKKISEVDNFMRRMGYKTRDEVFCCPEKLENYEARLKSFFEEHIHEDEEIRLIRSGIGYFDVRDRQDKHWVRIKVTPGDLIIVPAGCYHRFTMDESNYTNAIRLFSEVPKWTPLNRAEKETAVNASRVDYEQRFLLPVDHPERKPEYTIWKEGGAANLTTNVLLNQPKQFDETIRRLMSKLGARKAQDTNRFFKLDEHSKLSEKFVSAFEKKNSTIANNHQKIAGSEIPYLIVLYFTGAHFPHVNESWCPDCVVTDPIVARQLTQVSNNTKRLLEGAPTNSVERATPDMPFVVSKDVSETFSESELLEHAFAHLSFVQCNVQRASYLGNSEYLYRTHPFIQLKSIPTVMVLRVGLKGKGIAANAEEEAEGEAAHIPVDEAESERDVAVIGRYSDPLPEDWLTRLLSKQFGPAL